MTVNSKEWIVINPNSSPKHYISPDGNFMLIKNYENYGSDKGFKETHFLVSLDKCKVMSEPYFIDEQ